MLGSATQRLVRQIDRDGALIAVSRQNDSEKLKPLAVVIKRPAVWFWQSAKYRPTTFTLNDLLLGNPIETVVETAEFLKYKEKHAANVGGSMEAGLGGINLTAQGHGASKLSSSLGMLRKEMVNMQKLLQDSRGRKVDLQHSLIQQTLNKSQHVFTLVVERIFTSCECTIEYNGMEEGKCGGMWKALGIYPSELCLKESSSLQYDTNVAIELPSGSVLAYSVIQLDIKSDGRYELSACFDGFQPDDDTIQQSLYSEEEQVDGLSVEWPHVQKGSSLSSLKEVLSGVKASLCELVQLPVQTRSSLLLLLRQILLKRTLLSSLEDQLEMYCRNPSIPLETVSDKLIEDFLDLLQSHTTSTNGTSTEPVTHNGSLPAPSSQNGAHMPGANQNGSRYNGMYNGINQNGSHSVPSGQNGSCVKSAKSSRTVQTAMYMLVSAAEGLTDEGLVLLESLCSPEKLCGLSDLVTLLTDSEKPLPSCRLPAALQSDAVFLKVEALFSSGGVTLRREKQLWAEAESDSELLPAVLCMVLHGLAYLSQSLK